MSIRPHDHRALVVVLAILAVVSGVLVASPVAEGQPESPLIDVLAPSDRSQVPADGTVPVTVRLSHPLEAATFRAVLAAQQPATVTDVTGSFTVADGYATATLTAAQLTEGISHLTVSAQPGTDSGHGPHHAGRHEEIVTFSWEPQIDLVTADRCDFLDPDKCLFPFPNDHFTVPDPSMDTGKRINFALESMPVNVSGVHINPAEWNRNDGFSPGAIGLLHLPGVDLGETGAAPVTDAARSLDPDAPILMIDATTGERIPVWVEKDANATSPADETLMIRPATLLAEGGRYILAARQLRDGNGDVISAGRGFRLYRDRTGTFAPAIENRRAHFESIFAILAGEGIERDNLFLAWDFTVASERNLSERALHMRDDAFAALGDDAPAFTVTQVVEDPYPANGPDIARRVTGTFQVPHYLTNNGAVNSVLAYGPDGLPEQQGVMTADFTCLVPRAAAGQRPVPEPGRAVVYGHGGTGSHTEVANARWRAQAGTDNYVVCGTTTIGGLVDGAGAVFGRYSDLTNFRQQADRYVQALINYLFLGRLMIHQSGLVSHPAFRTASGGPAIDTSNLFYTGQSQGALMGGAVTAISQDWTRAVLTAHSMSAMLHVDRSVQGQLILGVFRPNYPNDLDFILSSSLLQMLFDRSENQGYAAHLTDDFYPNTPDKRVLIQAAFGDHFVFTMTHEVMARGIGMPIRRPVLRTDDRFYQVNPFFGIPGIPSNPYPGSGMVLFDFGNPPPPTTNTNPFFPDYGSDPHGRPSTLGAAQKQLSTFFDTGMIVDVCGGGPCYFGP